MQPASIFCFVFSQCNRPMCLSDRRGEIFFFYSQFTVIKLSCLLISRFGASLFVLFSFFHLCCQFQDFSIFQFKKHCTPPETCECCVSVFELIAFPIALHAQLLGFNFFLCISIITHPICCLICQTIHLKVVFP